MAPAPLKLVIAPDSFKGSARAADVARSIAEGWASIRPGDAIVLLPMADGGEGTLDAIEAGTPQSARMPVDAIGPTESPVRASWLLLADHVAIVELATASGIELLDELRPMTAQTIGFGQAIAAALSYRDADGMGVRQVLLALGGSASTDGGAGALSALGVRVLDRSGRPVAPGNAGLHDVESVDWSDALPLPPGGAMLLTDVTNPLFGPRGSAVVFGPQKGANEREVVAMEANLETFAQAVARSRPQVAGCEEVPGAGAAGGTAFGLLAWGARVVSGAARIADTIGLPQAIATADLVITGEGSFDSQSLAGKAPGVVLDLAERSGARTALVAGRIDPSATTGLGLWSTASLTVLAGSSEAALTRPLAWCRAAGVELARGYEQPYT